MGQLVCGVAKAQENNLQDEISWRGDLEGKGEVQNNGLRITQLPRPRQLRRSGGDNGLICQTLEWKLSISDNVQDEIQCVVENNVRDEIQGDIENNVQDEIQCEVEDNIRNDTEVDIEDDSSNCYSTCWEDLPTELLVKILSYLPSRDKMMMRNISHRFRDVSEIPLLWKEFVWPDCKPHHMFTVSKILKTRGEHVRRIFFPDHVIHTKILEMLHCCTKVTHLSVSISILSMMNKIVCMLTHLQQLDLFTSHEDEEDRYYIKPRRCYSFYGDHQFNIEKLVSVTTVSVKILKLQIHVENEFDRVTDILVRILECAKTNDLLPSVINFVVRNNRLMDISTLLFSAWSKSRSYVLPSFEIGIFESKRTLMNLHPPIPYCIVEFGPAATPPFIKLSNHGIVGLQHDVFHLREYDHYGTVRHAITPTVSYKPNVRDCLINYENFYENFNEENHINCISCLDSVSHIDIPNLFLNPIELGQLAVICPNLQRLDLSGNVTCLRDLQGLHAIVHTCQNLEGLNLLGISLSEIQSCLLLWELLSSIKRLTHLAIDMCCVMKPPRCNDADKQKLINMFKNCQHLRALELNFSRNCQYCYRDNDLNFLFSYFPFLTQCRMCYLPLSYFPEIRNAITYCDQLKYLYVEDLGIDDDVFINKCFHNENFRKLGYNHENIMKFVSIERLRSLAIEDKELEETLYELWLYNSKEDVYPYESLPVVPPTRNLQQLYIHSLCCRLTTEFVNLLSAHGGLERVYLCVRFITLKGILTLINNSPNLTVLNVLIYFGSMHQDNCMSSYNMDYYCRRRLPDHKLFTVGYCYIRIHFGPGVDLEFCRCDVDPHNSIIDCDFYSLWGMHSRPTDY